MRHVRGPTESLARQTLTEAATYAALSVLGAVLGVLGAFLSPSAPRVLGVPVPVGAVVALVGNLIAGTRAVRATGGRGGAIAVALGWVVPSVALGITRPEGDLVVTGSVGGVAFLLCGALGAAIAIARPVHRADRG